MKIFGVRNDEVRKKRESANFRQQKQRLICSKGVPLGE